MNLLFAVWALAKLLMLTPASSAAATSARRAYTRRAISVGRREDRATSVVGTAGGIEKARFVMAVSYVRRAVLESMMRYSKDVSKWAESACQLHDGEEESRKRQARTPPMFCCWQGYCQLGKSFRMSRCLGRRRRCYHRPPHWRLRPDCC